MIRRSLKIFSTLKWRNLLRVNNYILLFILGILLSPLVEAQKTHKVYGIKGVSIINENISYKEAKAEALNDAKINALMNTLSHSGKAAARLVMTGDSKDSRRFS
jgi:hypothetical protein